jgi:hypothetical protein
LKINPAEFFKFCARHTALLRELAERAEEDLSESRLFEFVRRNAADDDEQPETVVKQLKRLQIVEPAEQGDSYYILAGPLLHLLRFLLHEARPASSQSVQGFINTLDERCRLLRQAIEIENVTHAELAIGDINQTLRHIHEAVVETHQSILTAVAEFKTNRAGISVRQKFQRIVYWMEVYVVPMVHIIKVDGEMEATFSEVERLLRQASDRSVFNDVGMIERNLRFIRLVRRHALRVFEQCRKEIQPLYQSLAKSNNIAAGAAAALEWLRRDGLQQWGVEPLVTVFSFRQQYAVSGTALRLVLERVILQPPEPPPVVNFNEKEIEPAAAAHQRWLDSLPERARAEVPIDDLLGWVVAQHPDQETNELLAGFAAVFFMRSLMATSQDRIPRIMKLATVGCAPILCAWNLLTNEHATTSPGDF